MGRYVFFPSDPNRTNNIRIIVVSTDGRWEVWVYPGREFYVNNVDDDLCDGWYRDQHNRGQWDGASNQNIKYRVVAVHCDDISEVNAYAAELAAKLSGVPIARLNRRADGRFICPRCKKPYRLHGSFCHHLRADCGEQGLSAIASATSFRRRTRRSVAVA